MTHQRRWRTRNRWHVAVVGIVLSGSCWIVAPPVSAAINAPPPPIGFGPDWTYTASANSNGDTMVSVTIVNHAEYSAWPVWGKNGKIIGYQIKYGKKVIAVIYVPGYGPQDVDREKGAIWIHGGPVKQRFT